MSTPVGTRCQPPSPSRAPSASSTAGDPATSASAYPKRRSRLRVGPRVAGSARVEGGDAEGAPLARAPVGRDGQPWLVHVHDVEPPASREQARACGGGCGHGDRGAASQRERRAERERQRLPRRAREGVRVARSERREPPASLAQDRAVGRRRCHDDLVSLRGEPSRDGPHVVLDHAGLVRVERRDVRDSHVLGAPSRRQVPAGCGAAADFAAVRELRRMNSSTSSRALSS